jgi:hypothetical protein
MITYKCPLCARLKVKDKATKIMFCSSCLEPMVITPNHNLCDSDGVSVPSKGVLIGDKMIWTEEEFNKKSLIRKCPECNTITNKSECPKCGMNIK